jgi:hypothetical protein
VFFVSEGGGEEYIVYEPHADAKKYIIDNQSWCAELASD